MNRKMERSPDAACRALAVLAWPSQLLLVLHLWFERAARLYLDEKRGRQRDPDWPEHQLLLPRHRAGLGPGAAADATLRLPLHVVRHDRHGAYRRRIPLG